MAHPRDAGLRDVGLRGVEMGDVTALLDRLAAEVARGAAMAGDLQVTLAPIVRRSASSAEVAGIQSLDLLEQTLRDLAAVLAALSDGRDPVGPDALRDICKLDEVASRLAGTPGPSRDDGVEFF